ncbi:unnamed protein product [Prorocentrum cordatum]|uniref:Uncharacterized protein n=1 Tax=Prorocentrum cordatum TaxID=2364126 RepID=A0ABN9Y5A2_9DINO|nr:unnamed protein product [Polarella glacialis]
MPPQRKLLRRASALTLAAGACRLACRNGAASAAFAPGAAAAAPARAAADRADAERDADARVLANALRGARDARFSDLEPRARSGGYIAEAAPEMALNPPWATCYVEVQQATSSVLEERAWRGAVTCETVATFEGCWEEEPGVGHARRARRGRVVQRLEALLGGAYERQVRGHLRGGRPSGRVSGVRRQRRGVRRPREGLLQKRPGLAGLSPAGIQRHWQRLARHTRPCEAAAGGAGLCTTGPWHSGVAASAFVRYALWRHTAESSVNDSVGFEVLTGGAKRCSQSFNRVRGYPDECEWRAAKAAFEFASPFHPVQLRSSCHLPQLFPPLVSRSPKVAVLLSRPPREARRRSRLAPPGLGRRGVVPLSKAAARVRGAGRPGALPGHAHVGGRQNAQDREHQSARWLSSLGAPARWAAAVPCGDAPR